MGQPLEPEAGGWQDQRQGWYQTSIPAVQRNLASQAVLSFGLWNLGMAMLLLQPFLVPGPRTGLSLHAATCLCTAASAASAAGTVTVHRQLLRAAPSAGSSSGKLLLLASSLASAGSASLGISP